MTLLSFWIIGMFLNLLAIVFGEALQRRIIPKKEFDEAKYCSVAETLFWVIIPFAQFILTVTFIAVLSYFNFDYEAYNKWINNNSKKDKQ